MSTELNSADIASKGCFPEEFLGQDLWWNGLPYLTSPSADWPIRQDISDPPIDLEPHEEAIILFTHSPPELLRLSYFHKYVSFWAYPEDG